MVGRAGEAAAARPPRPPLPREPPLGLMRIFPDDLEPFGGMFSYIFPLYLALEIGK